MPTERKPWQKAPGAPARLSGRRAVERRRRWLEEHPLCVHCEQKGLVRAGAQVDHVIPLSAGGADDESNLQSLCRPHHEAKSLKDKGHKARPRVRTGLDGWPIE